MRVRVPDGCLGLDIAGGRSYDARDGIVDVDDADAPKLAGSFAGRHGFLMTGTTFRRAEGTSCPGCGFSAFAWQKECPRCGRRLKR